MKRQFTTIALAAALALCSACSTAKKAADANNSSANTNITSTTAATDDNQMARAQSIAASFANWKTMSCGGTFKLGGKKTFSSGVAVRMERDKFIYISLRPILGIEVGRLVFTGDSVIIVDKIHKQYIAENVSLLTNGLPATVSNLQDIFLGRAFTLDGGTYTTARRADATVTSSNGMHSLKPVKQTKDFSYEFTFNNDNHITALKVVPEGAKSTTYSVNYDNVKTTKAGNVAHSFKIDGTIKGNPLSLGIDYNKISWDENVKADLTIPASYKKVDSSNINNLLSGE